MRLCDTRGKLCCSAASPPHSGPRSRPAVLSLLRVVSSRDDGGQWPVSPLLPSPAAAAPSASARLAPPPLRASPQSPESGSVQMPRSAALTGVCARPRLARESTAVLCCTVWGEPRSLGLGGGDLPRLPCSDVRRPPFLSPPRQHGGGLSLRS